jgi:hypothetical protein
MLFHHGANILTEGTLSDDIQLPWKIGEEGEGTNGEKRIFLKAEAAKHDDARRAPWLDGGRMPGKRHAIQYDFGGYAAIFACE